MFGSKLLAPFVALAVLASACGGGGDDASPDESSEPSQSSPSTTTEASTAESALEDAPPAPPTSRGTPPTVDVVPISDSVGSLSVLRGERPYVGVLGQLEPDQFVVQPVALPPPDVESGISPFTGLPLDDPDGADRPAILVKLDNTAKGRPQESLSLADIVYVEQIEGGFTRLAAVYHTNAPELGPVRSGRTTDIALLGSLNEPIFVWSGANRLHAALLRRQAFVDLGAQTIRNYTRDPDRPGTYDLMTEAERIHELAAEDGEGGVPPTHFEFRTDQVGLPTTAVPADGVMVTYPGARVEWEWDGSAWLRSQDGSEHVDARETRVAAANVIVAFVDHVRTGSVDLAGSRVNEEQFIGQGDALVFTDGNVIEATWTKASILSVPTYTTADDVPIALIPGQTWIELAPLDSAEWS